MIYLILILFLFSLVSKTLRAFTRHGGRGSRPDVFSPGKHR